MDKKQITQKTLNTYGDKTDNETIKKLFKMGYDIAQIHLITGGVGIKEIVNHLTYADIIARCENIDTEKEELITLYNVTGIEFSQ
jgi:hypothetical protein